MTSRRASLGTMMGVLLTPVLARLGMASPPRTHGLLEFAEDGLPYRASTDSQSAYFWNDIRNVELRLSFNGVSARDSNLRCWEWDRREGWVLCDDENYRAMPRQYGVVKVWMEKS